MYSFSHCALKSRSGMTGAVSAMRTSPLSRPAARLQQRRRKLVERDRIGAEDDSRSHTLRSSRTFPGQA